MLIKFSQISCAFWSCSSSHRLIPSHYSHHHHHCRDSLSHFPFVYSFFGVKSECGAISLLWICTLYNVFSTLACSFDCSIASLLSDCWCLLQWMCVCVLHYHHHHTTHCIPFVVFFLSLTFPPHSRKINSGDVGGGRCGNSWELCKTFIWLLSFLTLLYALISSHILSHPTTSLHKIIPDYLFLSPDQKQKKYEDNACFPI